MSLGRECSHGHGRGAETLHDLLGRLHFIEGDARGGNLELKEVLDGDRVVVERGFDVFVVVFFLIVPDKGVEVLNDGSSEGMALTGLAVAIVARISEVERLACFRIDFPAGTVADE